MTVITLNVLIQVLNNKASIYMKELKRKVDKPTFTTADRLCIAQ